MLSITAQLKRKDSPLSLFFASNIIDNGITKCIDKLRPSKKVPLLVSDESFAIFSDDSIPAKQLRRNYLSWLGTSIDIFIKLRMLTTKQIKNASGLNDDMLFDVDKKYVDCLHYLWFYIEKELSSPKKIKMLLSTKSPVIKKQYIEHYGHPKLLSALTAVENFRHSGHFPSKINEKLLEWIKYEEIFNKNTSQENISRAVEYAISEHWLDMCGLIVEDRNRTFSPYQEDIEFLADNVLPLLDKYNGHQDNIIRNDIYVGAVEPDITLISEGCGTLLEIKTTEKCIEMYHLLQLATQWLCIDHAMAKYPITYIGFIYPRTAQIKTMKVELFFKLLTNQPLIAIHEKFITHFYNKYSDVEKMIKAIR